MSIISNKCLSEFLYENNDVSSQLDYYISNGSPKPILDLVRTSNKKFGSIIEKLLSNNLDLLLSKKHTFDLETKNKKIKIEVKSSRYWIRSKTWRWQHIDCEYDYDYLILCGVGFQELRFFLLSKESLIYNIKCGKIKNQGKQGYWFSFNDLEDQLIELKSVSDFNSIIN